MHVESEMLPHSRRCKSAIASYWVDWTIDFFSRLSKPFSLSMFYVRFVFTFTSIFCESAIRQRWCKLFSFIVAVPLAAYRCNFTLERDVRRLILTFHFHKPKICRPSNKNCHCENAFEFSRTVCLKLCCWEIAYSLLNIDRCMSRDMNVTLRDFRHMFVKLKRRSCRIN